ncbi:capsular polysaccharide synthesis protein [Leuconostoc lactis]
MKNILTKIKQRGIRNQLRQFLAAGMIWNAIFNTMTLGISKTTFELIQMNKMLKVKNKFRKTYRNILEMPLIQKPGKTSNIIWTMWLQGIDQAPDIVKMSIKSVQNALPSYKVIVLTKENFGKYVDVPEDIMAKWQNGLISNVHFSDIVRMELLIQKGGTWFDSTIVLDKNFPLLEKILKSNQTFFFQNMRPGQMGNSIWISNWLIHSRTNEPTLLKVREILYAYWRKYDFAIDYFIFHIIWHLVYEFHDDEYQKILKVPNAVPLQIMYLLNKKNKESEVERIFTEFPLQKITYKNITDEQGTVYRYLLDRKGNSNDASN